MMSENKQVPEGYKITELGVIPERWKVVTLGNEKYFQIVSGGTPSRSNPEYWTNGSINWATPTDITKNRGYFLDSTKEKISEIGLKNSSAKIIPKGSVLLTSRATIGVVAINNVDLATNQGFANFVLTEAVFNYYLLLTLEFNKQKLESLGGQSTFKEVSKTALKDFKILMPPLLEQQKIASILSKVDEQIEQTEQIIEKTELLKKGLMQKLLTKGIGHTKFKKTELGKIPEEWVSKKLSNLIEIHHGFAFESKYFTSIPNGIIVLVPGNFHRDGGLYFNKNTKYYIGKYEPKNVLSNGDLLIVMTDLSPKMLILGRTVKLSHNKIILHNQRIGKIEILQPEKLDDEYLVCLLNSDQIRNQIKKTATGTTVKHTSPQKIKSIKIPLPPLSEQQRIASILSKVDSHIQDNQNYLTKLQELKRGLMQDLLTGKVRVTV